MRSGRLKPWSLCWVLLLAALLPLRAWAVASMPIALAMPGSAPAAPMPCHAAADMPEDRVAPASHLGHSGHAVDVSADGADPAAAQGADEATPGSASGHTCASCVLCHSPLAAEAGNALSGPAPRTGAWVPLPSRDTGRLLAETLERPPRG
jgi:hypothetical protein